MFYARLPQVKGTAGGRRLSARRGDAGKSSLPLKRSITPMRLDDPLELFRPSSSRRGYDAEPPYGTGDLLERAAMIGWRSDFRRDGQMEVAFDLVSAAGARALGRRYTVMPPENSGSLPDSPGRKRIRTAGPPNCFETFLSDPRLFARVAPGKGTESSNPSPVKSVNSGIADQLIAAAPVLRPSPLPRRLPVVSWGNRINPAKVSISRSSAPS